jgi:hypothetical protein
MHVGGGRGWVPRTHTHGRLCDCAVEISLCSRSQSQMIQCQFPFEINSNDGRWVTDLAVGVLTGATSLQARFSLPSSRTDLEHNHRVTMLRMTRAIVATVTLTMCFALCVDSKPTVAVHYQPSGKMAGQMSITMNGYTLVGGTFPACQFPKFVNGSNAGEIINMTFDAQTTT